MKSIWLGPLVGFIVCFAGMLLLTENNFGKSLLIATVSAGAALIVNMIGFSLQRKKANSDTERTSVRRNKSTIEE